MKKFLFKAVLFLCLLAATDFAVGKVYEHLQDTAIGGGTKRIKDIADRQCNDILIFGASRAKHHYVAEIIEDSLGVGCYTCGDDGEGIIFNYGLYKLLASRYTPKLIVYDLAEWFDINVGDNTKFLGKLKRFYGRSPEIDSMFIHAGGKTYGIKMKSQLFRYNGFAINILAHNILPVSNGTKGYIPLNGVMEYENSRKSEQKECDSVKLYYWNKLIDDCRRAGTQLVFALSPEYKVQGVAAYLPLIELAEENGIPFLNHYNDSVCSQRREYFKDYNHLNAKGSVIYTNEIIKELRPYIQ